MKKKSKKTEARQTDNMNSPSSVYRRDNKKMEAEERIERKREK